MAKAESGDMLVKLYELPDVTALRSRLRDQGIEVRRALAPERHYLVSWIAGRFPETSWPDEAAFAFNVHPISCMIATQNEKLIGFQAFNVIAPGVAGPSAVDEQFRSIGVGKVLIVAALEAIREQGFAYGILGWISPTNQGYFAHVVGAIPIEGSLPRRGMYRGMVRG